MSTSSTPTPPIRKLKYGERATIRDAKGRPYYLSRLPFYKKYPRLFAGGGAILSFLVIMSGPIYKNLIRDNSNLTPDDYLWPSEKARGKSNRHRLLEKYCPEQYAIEMAEIEAKKQAEALAAMNSQIQ